MISNNNIRSKYAPFSDAPSCLREFLNYMLTILGRSPRTVDGYYIECRTFLRFIKLKNSGKNVYKLTENEFKNTTIFDIPQNDVLNVKLYDVYDFLNFVREQFGDDSCSRARKTTALRSFYKYLSIKANLIKENPLKSLESPSIKKSLPKYLTLEESKKLLNTATPNKEMPLSSRDYCILTLFLNCGMRLSELVGINLEDIRDRNCLHILGKGNKERTVYLNDACLDAINIYLSDTKEIVRDNNALFVGKSGKRLTPRRVEQLVEIALFNAGLSGNGFTPHKLRHTAATLMYQYGQVDIRVLKELLGHVSLSTTEIYTHVSNKQLENASIVSPLSNFKANKKE